MKSHYPKLTDEQEEQFKELYAKGYSARYIFKKLGQPYPTEKGTVAASRMRLYRQKLKLPKRGRGFKSIRLFGEDAILQKERNRKRRLERIKLLEDRIQRWTNRIRKWKQELDKLVFLVESSE